MLGFPLPYPNELIYSVIARHGLHSGIISPKELLREVFGNTCIIATIDLSSHLNIIANFYPKPLQISPTLLLYKHTLFPLYAPFIGEEKRQQLVTELTLSDKSFAHLSTGQVASRVKQPKFLRYCPACVEKQLEEYGECYWNRLWQVAGCECCSLHGFLLDTIIQRHNKHRHVFHPATHRTLPILPQENNNSRELLIAKSLEELLSLSPQISPEIEQWGIYYQQLAHDLGLSKKSRVNHEKVKERVLSFWGEKWLLEHNLQIESSEYNWLLNAFRKHRKTFSYLEHLVVLHALLPPGWKLSDVIQRVKHVRDSRKNTPHSSQVVTTQQIKDYRNEWLEVVQTLGTKRARLEGYGATYTWLYRHDREWLLATNSKYELPHSNASERVNWNKRDKHTVKELFKLLYRTEVQLDAPRRTRNWFIYQCKSPSTIEKKLHLLPLCSSFFQRYCEDVSEYQIRRITRTVAEAFQQGKRLKRWQILRYSGLSDQRLTKLAEMALSKIRNLWLRELD